MIDPYSGLMDVKMEADDYLDKETTDDHEDQGILNPYTGVLEVEPGYPNTEYLDLDRVSDTEEHVIDAEIVSEVESKSRKSQEKLWRETNKQEWLNIYQRYMEGRLERRPFRADLQRRRERRIKTEDLKKGKVEYPLYLDLCNSDQEEEQEEKKVAQHVRVEVKREFEDGETVDGEEKNEEYENVEYLTEELSSDEEDPPRTGRPGRRPDRNMAAALRAVCRHRATRLHAARAHRVPLDVLCARLQRLHARCHGKTKNRIVNKERLIKLRNNALKLLKYSNVCLFKWPKDKLACYVCAQRFEYMTTLRSHASTHSYKEIKRKILKHKLWFHKADVSDLICTNCDAKIQSLNDLQDHLRQHGISFETDGSCLVPYELCSNQLKCQLCKQNFTSKGLLQKHMDAHFLNHVCNVCSKGFHNARSLKIHKCHSHSKIKCPICGAILKNSYLKKRHDSRVHGLQMTDGMQRFKCSFCPEKFKYDYKRLQHLIEEHNGETNLFPCEFCPKIFMTMHWRMKHMNSVHREELDGIYY